MAHVEYDFEKDVAAMLPKITDDTIAAELGSFRVGDTKHRIIVCRHWLVGLCHNGIYCSFLHRLDKSRMPPCKHGKSCKIKNCPLKHVGDEELEECLFFKQGFCYNGPKCGRRHVKRLPEECPVEAAFEPLGVSQASTIGGGGGVGGISNPSKKQKTGANNDNYKVTLCTHWLLNATCPFKDECVFAHGELELNEGFQPNAEFLSDHDVYDPTRGQIGIPLELPFPTNAKYSYFILQSPDLRSLMIAKRRGVWQVPTRIAPEMNAAFRSYDHVILYFSVRSLRGIYGVGKMLGQVPQSLPGSPISPEFPIQWLRSIRISLKTVAQLKLGNSGMFVGRSSTDGRFENRVGLDMLLTAYRKPVWDWTKEVELAERAIRLTVEPAIMNSASYNGEYFPVGGVSAYHILPPDVLFAPDWVERAGLPVNEKGVLITPKQPFQGGGGGRGGRDGGFGGGGGMGGGGVNQGPDMATIQQLANDFYQGNTPAFIVCASTPIIEEVFSRSMMGLPAQFKDINTIIPGVPLFLFDQQANLMLGIFNATSPVTMNIDANAFSRWAGYGNLPVQFMFRQVLECPPIHIQDPELMQALGECAQTLGQIGIKETKALAAVFAKRAYLANPALIPGNRGGGRVGGMSGGQAGGGGRMGQSGGGGMAAGSGGAGGAGGQTFNVYKPPFKHVDVVPIDIQGSFHEIKRRLLGNNASVIIQLVDEIGVSQRSIKIRIRGIGSGFYEGPNHQELQEPLHFNVAAENEQLLQTAVQRVKALVTKVKQDLVPMQMH
jgi:uncharacterized membrane protein YgcG